jgi:hypothetical protein
MAAAHTEMLMRSTFDRKSSGEELGAESCTVAVSLPGPDIADSWNVEKSTVAAMEVAQIADWEVAGADKPAEAAGVHKSVATIAEKSNAGQPTEERHNAVKQNGSMRSEKLEDHASTQAPGGAEVHVFVMQHVQELV